MDPIINPYCPGAGTPPPSLAGRDALLERARIAIERTRLQRPSRGILMVGLRGVGKTVLLNKMQSIGTECGVKTLSIEAPEGRSLPGMLAPALRRVLLELSRIERVREFANRALSALAGFAGSLKLKYQDIEVGIDASPEPGLADSGDLSDDLQCLLDAVGHTCLKAETALVLFIDELQYVPVEQLSALITALHRATQDRLPLLLIGAGLPQLCGQMGNAKSYAERLFEFPEVGPLGDDDARYALECPAKKEGVRFESDALDQILRETQGYPYFLQEWGKHVWDQAVESPIVAEDVKRAHKIVMAALDESFFRVRLDRLTPKEKEYLSAMAALGSGPHRSGDIASKLGVSVQSVSLRRTGLIHKGMIWSPGHGDTAFTVPLFDEYMNRTMGVYDESHI